VTLAGQETVTAEGAETLRLTVPAKPERLVKVTGLLVEDPGAKETVGDEMLKSVIVTGRLTEWLVEPLVPLIETE